MAPDGKLVFTWRRKADEVWRGRNFETRIVARRAKTTAE
jgi:hypothetical protein